MVTDGNKKAAFFEKWNRLKRLPYLGRTTRKSITIFYHKGDWHCHFLPFERCFYFADHRAKSDIFQRKNSKLQQILSVFKTLCPLPFAPPSFAKATDGKPVVPFVDFFLRQQKERSDSEGCRGVELR